MSAEQTIQPNQPSYETESYETESDESESGETESEEINIAEQAIQINQQLDETEIEEFNIAEHDFDPWYINIMIDALGMNLSKCAREYLKECDFTVVQTKSGYRIKDLNVTNKEKITLQEKCDGCDNTYEDEEALYVKKNAVCRTCNEGYQPSQLPKYELKQVMSNCDTDEWCHQQKIKSKGYWLLVPKTGVKAWGTYYGIVRVDGPFNKTFTHEIVKKVLEEMGEPEDIIKKIYSRSIHDIQKYNDGFYSVNHVQ